MPPSLVLIFQELLCTAPLLEGLILQERSYVPEGDIIALEIVGLGAEVGRNVEASINRSLLFAL